MENIKKIISDKIIKTDFVEWKKFKFIQKKSFKSITNINYRKLKDSIIQNNFVQSFKVWQNVNDIYCLDGFHRCEVLHNLESEGFIVPNLMRADFIDCKNKKEAAKLVMVYSSSYADITHLGALEFLSEFQFDKNDNLECLCVNGLDALLNNILNDSNENKILSIFNNGNTDDNYDTDGTNGTNGTDGTEIDSDNKQDLIKESCGEEIKKIKQLNVLPYNLNEYNMVVQFLKTYNIKYEE